MNEFGNGSVTYCPTSRTGEVFQSFETVRAVGSLVTSRQVPCRSWSVQMGIGSLHSLVKRYDPIDMIRAFHV